MGEIKQQRVLVVRECLWELTDEDIYAAAALSQLFYWSLRTRDIDAYLEEEGERMAQDGDQANVALTHGWVYKTAEELSEELLEICSPQTIARRLSGLVEAGWLERRRNPRHKWDRTWQYRPNLKAIDDGLKALGYSLEDALPQGDWAILRDHASISHSEKSSSHSERSSSHSEKSISHSERAIPETTNRDYSKEQNRDNNNKSGVDASSNLVKLLTANNVSPKIAQKLVKKHDPQRIRQVISAAISKQDIHNAPGWIRKALEDNYTLTQPEDDNTKMAEYRRNIRECAYHRNPPMGKCPSERQNKPVYPWCEYCDRWQAKAEETSADDRRRASRTEREK